jgi:hypothetical protein
MSRKVEHLHPWMRPILDRHRQLARSIGLYTKIIETHRDNSGQLAAWMKGRNEAGKVINPKLVVTNARPGFSYHNVTLSDGTPASLAYHLALQLPGGGLYGFGDSKIGPAGIMILKGLGLIGEQLGLRWGGRWKSRDYTHFEFRPAAGLNITKVRAWVRADRPLKQIKR